MIDDLIKKKLQEDNDEEYYVQEKKFSPSAFGFCYRNQFWQRKQETKSNPYDIKTLTRFAEGRFTHKFIQSYLPEGITEVRLEIEDVKGRADLVLDDTAIDIKGADSYALSVKAQQYNIPTAYYVKKNPYYFLQVGWYGIALNSGYTNDHKKYDIKNVAIWGCCKGKLFYRIEHPVPLAELEDKVHEELRILRDYWSKDELPPAVPKAFGGRECTYCNFKDKCDKLEGK